VLLKPPVARPAPSASEPSTSPSFGATNLPAQLAYHAAEGDTAPDPGREVIVRVRDEAGTERAGARVYHGGSYVGLTDEEGIISVEEVRTGDELAALFQAYERPSRKAHHDLDGSGNWAWRVYQTSVSITDEGRPELFEVTDSTRIQELTVRRDQPLIGFHMVVCVEWDADSSYMSDLRRGLEKASALLYDVCDGQFFWEVIEIFDNRPDPAGCDMFISASNQQWPRGHMAGITMGQSTHMMMGRHFNGKNSNSGDWASNNGYRGMLHEFGHYGLGLWDEYPESQGKKSAPHAARLHTTSENACTSIMNDPYHTTGLCSRADPNYQDAAQAEHYVKTRGELTWETLLRRFADTSSPARWVLRSPVERCAIVPGPDAIPVDDWLQMVVTDNDTGACPPFEIQAVDRDSGAPMGEVEVWVDRSSSSLPNLKQGKADEAGRIMIYGAHAGDVVVVRRGSSTAAITVSCPGAVAGAR